MNRTHKTYLGDGVYASTDGYHLWLTTEDGLRTTNEIALEPEVLNALATYHHYLLHQFSTTTCPDCGRANEPRGHAGCQYPGRTEDARDSALDDPMARER